MITPETQRDAFDILIVEDSETQAELLRNSLATKGYRVTMASNGLKALAAVKRAKPSLIITDVVMPGMDGYQLCRAIKSDRDLKDIPVIIVTSLKEIDDIVTALECGADNFIRKPFDANSLLARIDYLMANRKLRLHTKLKFGIEINLGGKKHLITAEREQILDLLVSSYEEAVQANEELVERQNEVQALNVKLAARAVELEEANEQLRSFSHTVSHDLRSPLVTINAFTTILQRKFSEPLEDKAKHYLAGISQEASRMTRIVEDILYLSNIDRSRVTRSSVDLSLLVMEAVQTLRDTDPDRRVEFECVPQAIVECDERLVRIALSNLLSNAWKFTSKRADARIRFSAEKTERGETVFRVKDNGAGFDMQNAGRLFTPFERLHRNDEFPGFGVGLATVQRVIALHGGRIWADSAIDKGAVFQFTLDAGSGTSA
ncbi:MAG TPA: response regulator [Ramlibacter sp.]|nr:response regulator [Ramlibacter sp.]